MPAPVDPLSNRHHRRCISRRAVLSGLSALMLGRRIVAQPPAPIRVAGLHQVTLAVSDPTRSVRFYQDMFGMPVQARQGGTTLLRIGDGPKFLAIRGIGPGESPRIAHLGIGIEGFDAKSVVEALERHGVTRAAGAGGSLSGGPMRVRLTIRDGTPEVFLGDPEGIVVQLQDVSYCGGSGPLGAACAAPEPAPSRGAFALRDLSHFTIQVDDGQRANQFYRSVFGLDIQAMQAATPALGVGPGVHFLMFTGGGAARGGAPVAPRPARIDHVCFGVPEFVLDAVTSALEARGIKPRGTGTGAAGAPLLWWVSMRMPNRGGAPEGTPELYFSDPDGLSVQLQDVKYCGGGGYLGEIC
jgi:catechol 2,3-dioxygenase-like lactoylglutathione lyase family enzyme